MYDKLRYDFQTLRERKFELCEEVEKQLVLPVDKRIPEMRHRSHTTQGPAGWFIYPLWNGYVPIPFRCLLIRSTNAQARETDQASG